MIVLDTNIVVALLGELLPAYAGSFSWAKPKKASS